MQTAPRLRSISSSVVTLALGLVTAAAPHAAAEPATTAHAVGVTTLTFVDRSRPTAANGKCAKVPTRTLPTTIFYPATGNAGSDAAQPDAKPDPNGAPYPLIVFAHGFSSDPQDYASLLRHWAAAGFVVAAPTFPLSSRESPCGAASGDSVNQPQDLSFVIDSVLKEAAAKSRRLAALVDLHAIGAAGHSNGGITMYGLIANTKRRDPRVRAVAVLAGTPQGYPTGRYDFTKVPPILLVHGRGDQQVPYDAAVSTFNRVRGPKALLTITGGDHGSAAGPQAYAATTDWFDTYLRNDSAAKDRLRNDQMSGVSTMKYVSQRGATVTIPTVPQEKLHLQATVTPRTNLTNGQVVTVKWSGYTAGKAVNILECNPSDRELTNSAGCDYTKASLLHDDPTGEGSLQLTIVEGQVGDGVCDAKHPGCFILINNASSTDPTHSVFVKISFAKQ